MSDDLHVVLVFAMTEESQDVFDGHIVLHTGIGKVNAVYGLMQYFMKYGIPDLVVNMGTAGSRRFKGGDVVNPTQFIQRDMDVTFLGVEAFKTPFSKEPVILEYGLRSEHLANGICGTGDNFDASEKAAAFDFVDMEAYALALTCKRHDVPFLCLKYISDGADDEADDDWRAALHHAAEALKNAYEQTIKVLEARGDLKK